MAAMQPEEYRRLLAKAMSEDDLQDNIADLCRTLSLPYYHTHDSRRSPEGFPDTVIVSGVDLLIFELKNEKADPSPKQMWWLDALSRVERVRSGVWRPRHWLDGVVFDALGVPRLR